MANFRIEIRYAVLSSLLMLLWLAIEYMVGLQDTYIQYHPYVNILSFILIPIVCIRLALNDKREQLNGKLSFKQAFITGFLVTFFAAIFFIPCQIIFYKWINPDFFDDMIARLVSAGDVHRDEVDLYYNLTATIIRSGFLTLVFGTAIAAATAWSKQTEK
jgi:hypothetical protein